MANTQNGKVKVSQLESVKMQNIDSNDFFLYIDQDNPEDKTKKLTMGLLVEYMLSAMLNNPEVSANINQIANAAVEDAVEDLDISSNVIKTIQDNPSIVLDLLDDGEENGQFVLDTNK